MTIPGIINRLCAESGTAITASQWNQYLPGVAYTRPCPAGAYLPGTGAVRLPGPATTPLPPAPAVTVAAPGLHAIDWPDTPVPGEFCGVRGLVTISKGEGWASSVQWGRVHLTILGPPVYGDLQGTGTQDAAEPVMCDNGGGMADSQITEAYLFFALHGRALTLLGAVTPQEQQPGASHIPLITGISVSPGTVVAHEDWYRSSDHICCSTGRAVTIWTYRNGKLIPGTPDITS